MEEPEHLCIFIDETLNFGFEIPNSFASITLLAFDLKIAHSQKKKMINVEGMIELRQLTYSGPPISSLLPAVKSYYLLEWLQQFGDQFHTIYLPVLNGIAYYSLLAKHQGWAFEDLNFYLLGKNSTLFNKHSNKRWIENLDEIAADFMERESFRLADDVIIENGELKKWMADNQWNREIKQKVQTREGSPPLVSICLTHFNRPRLLVQSIESIKRQDYPNYEVILVDDGSTDPEAIIYLNQLSSDFEKKGWTLIKNPRNVFPGAARNIAAKHSRGEYLLFMDDDNAAFSNELSFFVKVAQHVNADILSCAMDLFYGLDAPDEKKMIHRFLPIGASINLGLYLNLFGDMNALIKKSVFEELKGLTEERNVGGEDWEFFNRAALKGYHLEVIPKSLFWYRDTPQSVNKTTHLYSNSMRAIKPYLERVPFELHNHLIMSQSQQEQLQQFRQDWNQISRLLNRIWTLLLKKIKKYLKPKNGS